MGCIISFFIGLAFGLLLTIIIELLIAYILIMRK